MQREKSSPSIFQAEGLLLSFGSGAGLAFWLFTLSSCALRLAISPPFFSTCCFCLSSS